MLSLLLILCFLLPAEAGEKISLGITILLTFIVFLLLLDTLIPKSSTLPYINDYIVSLIVLATLTILLKLVILNIYFSCKVAAANKQLNYLFSVCLS